MSANSISKRAESLFSVSQNFLNFYTDPRMQERLTRPGVCDFLVGDPQEMPLEGFPAALQKWSVPQNRAWFGYKMSEPASQEIVAASLRKSHHLAFEAADICMTNGAFAALAVTLGVITDPGDEIIFISPPWFFYEMLITSYYGKAVRVYCDPQTFDLDLAAIRNAITPRTRGIIINSPNNPTGRIYPPDTLRALADLLLSAGKANGRPIYLLSDESYNHILYDGKTFTSPLAFYPYTFLIYTFGKTLLTPGQRIGYIALPPGMPDRETVRNGLLISQVATGYAFPNALLQHALEDLEKLSIDIGHLQVKRDRMVGALREMGYQFSVPEGTFYLLVKSPLPDDMAFFDLLYQQNIFCLPGSTFEMPGYFRISLTANDDMIERSLPGFARALADAREIVGAAHRT